jgi:hypothetical protein
MLGCAFFVTLFAALCGLNSGYVPLAFGVLWVAKMIFMESVEAEEAKRKAEAAGLMHFYIYSGVETYTPQPLAEGMRCKVVVQGTDRYRYQGPSQTMLDAAYLIRGGEYSRHQCFLLNGSPAVPFEENLHDHCYSFPCFGTGRQLSVYLRLPQGIHADADPRQRLEVRIWKLTAAEEVLVKVIEDERQQEAAAIQQEELSRQALELATAAHLGSNFLSEEYQKNYARKFTARVLDRLGAEWLADYRKVLADDALSAILTQQHPHVMPFLEARLQVIRLAEQFAVTPEPTASRQKPRLTRAEWETRIERYRQRQLDRMRVSADDRIATMLEKVESVRRLRDRAEELGLDEDQIERLEQELMGDLQDDEDEHNKGFKQV